MLKWSSSNHSIYYLKYADTIENDSTLLFMWKQSSVVVQYLIEKGFEETIDNQRTPLNLTSLSCKTDVAKHLLTKGANKNAKQTFKKSNMIILQTMK